MAVLRSLPFPAVIRHTAQGLVRRARPRPAAIIVLAGTAVILVGIAGFGYTTTISPSEPDTSSGGIVLGLALSIVPGLLGSRMLFRRPTVWQGVGGLAVGIVTFLVQRLLVFLALLTLTVESEAYLELQPGFWLSLAGCAMIAIGGVVCLVQALACNRTTSPEHLLG